MKKLLFLLVVAISVFGLAAGGLASAVNNLDHNGINPGCYSTDDGIINGFWYEYFGIPNTPGSPGSVVHAKADDLGQWKFQSGGLVSVEALFDTSSHGGTVYRTVYSADGACLALGQGPWGYGGDVVVKSIVNLSESYQNTTMDHLAFSLMIEGCTDGKQVFVNAYYDGKDLPLIGFNNGTTGHQGQPFERIEMTVTPIPGTFLLFGTGLVGLAGLRRRFRK